MGRSTLAVILLAAMLSCGGKSSTPPTTGSGSPLSDLAMVQLDDAPQGIDLRVSDGKLGPPAFDRAKLAPATKLDAAATQTLLSRTKPITPDASDQQAFALRPRSQPAPRTGTVVTGTFPPPASSLLPPKASDAGQDLQVLRYMPEGKVPIAPELSVTFSQAMVAVTSQGDASGVQPVKLSPQPKGSWRWLGTRTLLFDPVLRFPQATTYTVEVPAGTKSTNGGALKTATKFTFETPTPTLIGRYPHDSQPQHLDVPMFALFDQKIDPQAVFSKLTATAEGKQVKLELLDDKAIAALKDKQVAALIESANRNEQTGRYLAFRAIGKFPPDTEIQIEFPAGTPSAEGPNTTPSDQRFGFHTFPPLRIERNECSYGSECPPNTPLFIEFNNPLDDARFDDSQLSISPAIPGVHYVQNGSGISIQGLTKARTTYKVRVSGGVLDEFGQTLGKDADLVFKIGNAQPNFFGPNGMVVVDPSAKTPTLDFFTTNYQQLKVRLYKVTPADYDAYGFYVQNQWNKDKPPRVPGTKVFDQLVKTAGGANELVETHVELSPALTSNLGHALAIVEPYPWTENYDPPRLITWAQSTKLGIDAHVDGDNLVAYATELASGKPIGGLDLEMRPSALTSRSDDKGLATIALPTGGKRGAGLLLAKRGSDVAFVTENSWYDESAGWVKQSRGSSLAWYVVDDRRLYKPGEEVHLKGWLRTIDYGKNGDVGAMPAGLTAVSYTVSDSRGNEIGKGSAPISAVGGWDTKFTLPRTPNLGFAYVSLKAGGSDHSHALQVEEFRRPEFEVRAQASQGPFIVGGTGDVTVHAKYFSGGPLPGAPVNWFVTANATNFTPPNRDEYVFGEWTPWWGYSRFHDAPSPYRAQKTWNHVGKTDAIGAHTLHFDFLSIKPARPMSVTANASVTDVNRQTWTSSAAIIVHPATAYVGLKTKRPFVDKGTPFEIDVIGVDLDGTTKLGAKIELKAVRKDWEYKKGRYVEKDVDPQTCGVVAAKDPVPCSFKTTQGGTYSVTATIVDDRGRANTTSLTFWVGGGDTPKSRDVAQEKIQLIPDKKDYSPGNTAELLLQAPFYPAEGLVTWRRGGMVKIEKIALTGPTKVITVPITDQMTPNLHVQVDLVGASERLDDKGDPDPKLPKRPAYAVGTINLSVPPRQRTLAVSIAPAVPKLGPGETTKLTLAVKDAAGRPVADAEVAVIVVDEAILSLTGYQFPDPVGSFYPGRSPDTRDHYSRAYVKLAKPDPSKLAANSAPRADFAKQASAGSPGGPPPPPPPAPPPAEAAPDQPQAVRAPKVPDPSSSGPAIAIRSNFNPLAAFAPAVKTNAQGGATVEVKVPDNLTRYRIIAIATAGTKQFGKGESALTARLPLMVRPSPPRFLNFGDTFELPVVVQNQTDTAMTVRLAARTTNAALTDNVGGGAASNVAGRQVTVPANDRVEVRFPAAAEMAGTARFQLVAAGSGGVTDAAELALPVWTPATTEAFATYGVINEGASGAMSQQVALPGKVITAFGGLEVTTASTNLQALTDALIYLVRYPYECAEQRASRIIGIVALKDVLVAFKAKDLPSIPAMEASVKADIERLSQMQNYDGGYAYWERGRPSDPYLTVFVTNALTRAKAKGFDVPQRLLDQAKPFLKDIEQRYPVYYGMEVRRTISSYALYTRKLMGDLDLAKAQKLIRDAGGPTKLNMEANAWLLGTLAGNAAAQAERAAIVRHAMNKVSETAGAANFTVGYADQNYVLLSSDRRVDAVMLESLIQEQQNLDLIPKLVTGLLAHRKAGKWLNTQENTFALLAMDLYFRTYEKTTPDFIARVWLGNDYAGDKTFKGRSTDYFSIPIRMVDVAAHDKQNLTIQKDGKAGRLYYRVGMTYAPASLKVEPADYGFVVTRVYEGVDDPKDVVRQPDGTWKIKAGARVRIRLNVINENRRYHVAMVDPLPAGFEPMNPALATTGPIPQDPSEQKSRGAYWWWYGPWYEHQNMRDERVEAFASLLWQGVHRYDYVARATTPGNFVVPPPKAEEMYMPETFGRGGSDRVIIE